MFTKPPYPMWLKQAGAMIVGSLLYALAIHPTAILEIPSAENVQVRPGIAIPIICGALFGPAAGFVSGFAGNILADQMRGEQWWPFWHLGNGLMGLVSGLFRSPQSDYSRLSTALGVLWRGIAGIIIGMAVASISEHWVSASSWDEVLWINFFPATISNIVTATILVPIILLIYGLLRESADFETA